MEITGKIIAVLPEKSGVSKSSGNQWKSQEFVIETNEQPTKRMVFRVFGEERLQHFDIKAGDEKRVCFDISAREWDGRWFNDVSAWNVEPISTIVPPSATPPTEPTKSVSLPF